MHYIPGFGGRSIPVSMQSYSWRIVGKGWADWFKLVSSLPNLQPNFFLLLRISSLVYQIFLTTSIWQWLPPRRQLCVWRGGFKEINITNLKTVTCLGCFNIKNFTKVVTSGGFFFTVEPICCAYQNLCMTFTKCLGLLLNFSTS